MNPIAKIVLALPLCALVVAAPADARRLSTKEKARVERAAPEDQDAVYNCLMARKKGAKKGTLIGGGAGAGAAIIAGASAGGVIVATAAGAVAGNLIGKGTSTDVDCDEVLERNE